MLAVQLGYLWASSGFPTITPTHKLAASLMATHIAPDLLPEIALPWSDFALLVPAGLLGPIGPHPVTRISHSVVMVGLSMLSTSKTLTCWYAYEGHGITHVRELPRGLVDLIDDEMARTSPADRLLGRLLIGALIELDQPRYHESVRKGPPPVKMSDGKKGRTPGPPSSWVFELRRDVTIDLRPWVRDYVAGGGKKTGVQILVRGHHKRQRCGPKGADRMWIHIQPYWRGPEDAPIAMRGHRLSQPTTEPEKQGG